MNRFEFLTTVPKGSICAEIGVYQGEFAHAIKNTIQPSQLYLIDCWQKQEGAYAADPTNGCPFEELYHKVCHEFPEAKIVRKFSCDAVCDFPDEFFDFIYLDADHSYDAVAKDVRMWYPKVKRGGIFSGHDYVDRPDLSWIEAKVAIDDWLKETGMKLDVITREDVPSWAIYKKHIKPIKEHGMKLYFSCMINCKLLPHFLKHYTELGVDTFICVITGNEAFVKEVKELSKGYNLIIEKVAEETSNWTELDVTYTRLVLDKYCSPDEWIVLADLDEFHVYRKDIDLSNFDYVTSKMVDRFASDGTLKEITDENIFAQYPIEKQYTTGCLDKVILTKAKNLIGPGHHNTHSPEARRYPEVYSTKHFKWHSGLKHNLYIRLAEVKEAWRVELIQQMKDFNMIIFEDYWQQAVSFGILQRKNEFFKFLAWLQANSKLDSYLEIGCCGGGTAFYFNKIFKKGLSVDMHKCWNGDSIGLNWSQYVGNSNNFNPEQYDFIFIDGDHSYEGVKKDYEHFKDHCKIMAFHDIIADHPINSYEAEVKKLWDEIKVKHNYLEFIDMTPSDCVVERLPLSEKIKNSEWGGIGVLIL